MSAYIERYVTRYRVEIYCISPLLLLANHAGLRLRGNTISNLHINVEEVEEEV